jgi:hypothetical protein
MSLAGKDNTPALSRKIIMAGLQALSDALGYQGITGEICLFGGTAMMLAFNARLSTKDVDAIFQPAEIMRAHASRIARDHGLPEDWLNDGVKGFVSAKHRVTQGNLPQFAHLRLTMPVPEYLLAMKCMAARIGGAAGESTDVADIVFLARHLHLGSARETLEIVAQYYPANRISPKTQYLIEGLYDEGKI